MRTPRLPLLVLLAFVAACAAWLLSLDPAARFTTDVTELLPADERDPEARLALSLVRERQARVILITLDAPPDTPAPALAAAAQVHAASLLASGVFASAYPLSNDTLQSSFGALLHARRFDLLFPAWLASSASEALAKNAVAALDAHLASPDSAATADLLPSDPLLLLPSLAARADSLAATPPASPNRALIWAESLAPPLSEAGQQPVFAALAAAESAARVELPSLTTRFAGVARFAAAAKASTRAEIGKLNLLALAAVLLVSALFIRRLHHLLHLLPPVLVATLGAVTVTTLVFPRVHVLVFVLGSLLCGVAVDYSYHLVLARRPDESYRARLRRLALPLLGGAGTTFAGFLLLLLSELPLMRQLGVYVAAGIAAGLCATVLYFSLFPGLDLRPRPFSSFNLNIRLSRPRFRLPLIATIVLLAAFGLSRATWHDDLRSLEYPSPSLRAEDAAVRSAFGEKDSGATFLTRGATYAEARANWQLLANSSPPDNPPSGVASLVPTPADYAAATNPATRAALATFAESFRAEAEAAGFDSAAFAPFYADFAAYLATPPPDYETLLQSTFAQLPGPLGLLVHSDPDGVSFLSSTPHPAPVPPAALGTVSLSGLQTLNHLFARYRATAAKLSLLGCVALVVIACALNGLRPGLRTAALPLLAAALALGLLALRGDAFGLFHLLGALVGVCLADDYAHFAHSDSSADFRARAAIRLSAFTTAASFAVLMLSAIPALSALGATVTLIVLLALLFVETDLLGLRCHG